MKMESKQCCHCREVLPLNCFQKNRTAPDGLQYRCKKCAKVASTICRAKRGHLWLQKTNPWKNRNREKANASRRSWRAKNSEKVRCENKKYRELRNPFAAAVAAANVRSKRFNAISTLTTAEWREVVERENFVCHICGEKTSLELYSPQRLSLDHVIPLSRGGHNVKENVLPAHRRCNQSRLDMLLNEFNDWLKKVFKFRSIENGAG
jgi:5-methylcytosine-specific restriction enzyme A